MKNEKDPDRFTRRPRPIIATLEELEAQERRLKLELSDEDFAALMRVGDPIGGDTLEEAPEPAKGVE